MANSEATVNGIYVRLKQVIANEKNWGPDGWKRVFATQKVQSPPLSFTAAGQRGLTPRLNEEFTPEGVDLTRDKVGGCETVKDLFDLVWEQI